MVDFLIEGIVFFLIGLGSGFVGGIAGLFIGEVFARRGKRNG